MANLVIDCVVGSLNVRGINREVKRKGLYDWIEQKKIDIMMLQECYCTPDTNDRWSDEWGGECFFSNGTSHSCGTMILFRKGLDISILESKIDLNGRYIILKVDLAGEEFVLVNIYGPTKQNEKNQFYEHLNTEMALMDISLNDKVILGGDWNVILDKTLDRKGGSNRVDPVPSAMNQLIDTYEMVDLWRIEHPELRRFTYRRSSPIVQSRLDYFLSTVCVQDLIHSSDIIPSFFSDHSAVFIHLKQNAKYNRGKGYWKYNVVLNKDEEFVKGMKQNLVKWKFEYKDIEDKRIVWELIKYEIRKYVQTYSREKAKIKRQCVDELNTKLTHLETLLAESPDTETLNQLFQIKKQLQQIEEERVQGLMLRANVKWHEEGEKCSKYFFDLEKQNYIKKNMTKIKVNDKVITDQKTIQEEQVNYYRNLYSSKISDKENISDSFFLSRDIKQLSESDVIKCNTPITKQELKESLHTFTSNKTPGNDGLPYEYYKMFWDELIDPLYDCYEAVINEGELSCSQKQAVMRLLEKKGKDRSFISNWRPISLLNFDYKLLSKCISRRIQNFLPHLIHRNQTGFIKGRYIGDSIRVIQDIMAYTLDKKLSGLLLFIDFEKAFDSIEWKFIWKALKRYNIGDYLINLIQILYTNPESCVMNNGFSSRYFSLHRGVRQGDPLSPYIFILALELLAVYIREDPSIRGFKIKETEIKLTLYADDMTLMLRDKHSAIKALDIIKKFEKESGLKMNIEKCEGMWLGIDHNNSEKPFGIRWPNAPIKVLGIYLSYDKTAAIKANFEDKIASLLKQLHWWKARKLSLTGKILIVKALGLSKFVLLASLLHIPQEYVIKINSIIYNFIWNGKSDKVKRSILSQDYYLGGMRMLDFKHVVASAQLHWLQRYLTFKENDWRVLFEYFLNVENPVLYIRSNFSPKEFSSNMPDYYKECLNKWQMMRMKQTDELIDFVWYNKDVRIDKKVVYCENMFLCGLWTINDLYDDNGSLLSFETWKSRGVLSKYYLLWRGLVKIASRIERSFLSSKYRRINRGFIELEWQCIAIDCVTEKEIKTGMKYIEYKTTINKNGYKAMLKYDTIHGSININEWTEIYTLPRLCIVDNVVRDTQYKILHRFFPTQSLLFKMNKINSPLCLYCNLCYDSVEHAVFECFVIKNFWFEVIDLWNNLGNCDIRLDVKIVTFGFFDTAFEQHELVALNSLILYGKQYVFQQKFQNCSLSQLDFKRFLAVNLTKNESGPAYILLHRFFSIS